jgi:uncharacterized protein (TIGR00661 family)
LKAQKNILICPLEWGLGHAGRMIPVAKRLRELNNVVYIGAGNEIRQFFRNELDGLEYIEFGGFRPSYSAYLPQYFIMLLKLPLLIYHIISEHYKLKRLISRYKIDIVISDNRFGLWNKKIKSVYVTHQLTIPFPEHFRFLEWTGSAFHRFIIGKYDKCLIPDLPGDINFTGRLSHIVNIPANAEYIGILSRFNNIISLSGNKYDHPYNTLILSGPEPQRGIFRELVVKQLTGASRKLIVLEGRPEDAGESSASGNTSSFSHLPPGEMKRIITGSEGIILRAGYTSVMELVSMNCTALLVPTPGQTEQEYIAEYLAGKGWFSTVRQRDLKSGISLPTDRGSLPHGILEESVGLLEKALKEILYQ